VNYTTAALAIGSYGASITITDIDAFNNPYRLPVSLKVRGTPVISLDTLSFASTIFEGENAPDDLFSISNLGVDDDLIYTITGSENWLSFSPDSGSIGIAGSQGVIVDYSTSALDPGNYSATITIADPYASNNPQTISVTLIVKGLVETEVASSSDDAEERILSGGVSLTSSDLEMVEDEGPAPMGPLGAVRPALPTRL